MPTSVRTALRYLVLVVIAVIVLFPIYITLVNALLPGQDIAKRPPTLFPLHPLWSSFSQAWTDGSLGPYLRTSAIVSIATTLAALATSILAAYAFAFLEFPLKRVLFALCLATLMVPAEVTIIPNYRTIQLFGWYDTYPALIVPFVASGIGIFLFRQSFRQLPRDLRDAAVLDGYGHCLNADQQNIIFAGTILAALPIFVLLLLFQRQLVRGLTAGAVKG